MVTLDNVSQSFSGKTLFENVSITFNPQERYGLTGPNGAGKSTLLKIITGQIEPHSGFVSLPKRVGFLQQNIEDFRDEVVLDVVMMGNKRLYNALKEKDFLYEQDMSDSIGLRLGELEEIILEEDGYTAESEAEILLQGIGISEEHILKKMDKIPTDWQFRVLLCQALFGKPQALFLDEPTNHLDLDSISWLEKFLKEYTGVLIIISHDKHFLNSITTAIADIDYETIIIYPGNYDQMLLTKTQMRASQEKDIQSKEKKIAQLKEFVSKFSAGTRASQVQSRLKEINKLQPQELKKTNIQRPYIRFNKPEKQSGKLVIGAEKVSKSFKDNDVIKNINFEIYRGDKVAIIGNNGKGKTTLVQMLAQKLTADQGEIKWGHQVELQYFPQLHHECIDEHSSLSAYEWLCSQKEGAYEQEIRGVLGRMLFSKDEAHKKIQNLSGGEKARLILACIMLHSPNLLILDEPNNHLDLESVSALGTGLEQYEGTIICVSHNRDLISSFANRIISFEEEHHIQVFDGPLEEYLSRKK